MTRIGNEKSKAKGRWTEGKSLDGKGEFKFEKAMPHGKEPNLGAPHPSGFAQNEQMTKGVAGPN